MEDGAQDRDRDRNNNNNKAKDKDRLTTIPRTAGSGLCRHLHDSSNDSSIRADKEDKPYHSNQLKDRGKELDLHNLAMDLQRNLPRPSVRMDLPQVVFLRLCRISSLRCSTLSLKVDLGGLTQSLLVGAGVRLTLVLVRIQVKIKVQVKIFPTLPQVRAYPNHRLVKLILPRWEIPLLLTSIPAIIIIIMVPIGNSSSLSLPWILLATAAPLKRDCRLLQHCLAMGRHQCPILIFTLIPHLWLCLVTALDVRLGRRNHGRYLLRQVPRCASVSRERSARLVYGAMILAVELDPRMTSLS